MSHLLFSWQVLLPLKLRHSGTARPPNPSPRSSNKEGRCGWTGEKLKTVGLAKKKKKRSLHSLVV